MNLKKNDIDFWDTKASVVQFLDIHADVQLAVKREDLLHPFVSGNKFRKLKYNVEVAINQRKKTLVTFGGAFSNHIAAVAFVGQNIGLQTIGFIRGEELEEVSNPTLDFARQCGMKLYFISREFYQNKDFEFLEQHYQLNSSSLYWIPEGGTNSLAVKGCEEILNHETQLFDYVCSSVGTAGTVSGLINSAFSNQKVLGFPALKGSFLQKDIRKFAKNSQWELMEAYHFGGYGKINTNLVAFINDFFQTHQIPLDPIYTGKMFFGVMDLIKNGYFPKKSKILLIHTGGLQGIGGMNLYLKKKGMPLIVDI